MCGIAGILTRDSKIVEESLLIKMRDSLVHRGPDDAGIYMKPGVALASRRLSILDLSSNGRMPMQTPDGRYVIIHNGEIFNYQDFYPYLKSKGWKFKSGSDTEVLLYLFAQDGPAMLDKLNGMFAFAIWDDKEKKLFAVRDRLGIKPFFYGEQNGDFYFASEEKALFKAGIEKEFDPGSFHELFYFRFTAGEKTPYKGVHRLLPGHYLVWQGGNFRTVRWWNLSEKALNKKESIRDSESWFQETFDDAVRLRSISDVPVGILLSGGLDSSSIAASLALQTKSSAQSFTVAFAEPDYDERFLARQTAAQYGIKNHELVLSKKELPALYQLALFFNDEPLAHASDLYLYAVSKYAKQNSTVLLAGEGADEILGGYVRYSLLKRPFISKTGLALSWFLNFMPKNYRFHKLRKILNLASLDHIILFGSCEVLPEKKQLSLIEAGLEYRRKILGEAKKLYFEPMRQAMYYDQHVYLVSLLERNDRMSMGASVECRTPFLDHRLVEGLAGLPSKNFIGCQNKMLIRKSIGSRLPAQVLAHKKWGFGVPWGKHLREVPVWRDAVAGLAKKEMTGKFFEKNEIAGLVRSFLGGDTAEDMRVYQLFNLQQWFDYQKITVC